MDSFQSGHYRLITPLLIGDQFIFITRPGVIVADWTPTFVARVEIILHVLCGIDQVIFYGYMFNVPKFIFLRRSSRYFNNRQFNKNIVLCEIEIATGI